MYGVIICSFDAVLSKLYVWLVCVYSIRSADPTHDIWKRISWHSQQLIVPVPFMVLISPCGAYTVLVLPCSSSQIDRYVSRSFSREDRSADKKTISDPLPSKCTNYSSIMFLRSFGPRNSCPFHLLRAPWSYRICRSWLLGEVAHQQLATACVVNMNAFNLMQFKYNRRYNTSLDRSQHMRLSWFHQSSPPGQNSQTPSDKINHLTYANLLRVNWGTRTFHYSKTNQ